MNRKSKLVVAGLGAGALAAGATFATAQYGKGWRGHGMHRAGLSFGIGISCGDGPRADRMLERLEQRIKPTDGAPRSAMRPSKGVALGDRRRRAVATRREWRELREP
jgi:hypothetical protein